MAAESYTKALEEAGKIAAWDPTPENVEHYMRMQRVVLDKASLFSDVYRRAVWTNPDLNYEYSHPMMQLAKSDSDDTRKSDRDLFLRNVSKDIGLYYVFAGHCAPCKTASPIIKNFSIRFGVPVRPISTDGAVNPYFEKTLPENGQLAAWGVDRTVTPALLIYQSQSPMAADGTFPEIPVLEIEGRKYSLRPCEQKGGCLTYLASGVLSTEDIADRAFTLLSKEPGAEY